MVPGLDAGPVLGRYTLRPQAWPTIGAYRNVLSTIMPLLLIDSFLGVASGRIAPSHQPKQGRQYYFIHPTLEKVLDETFQAQFDPSLSGGEAPMAAMRTVLNDPALAPGSND